MNDHQHLEAPPRRMIADQYYDGIIDGYAECPICGETLFLSMVAADEEWDRRMFTVAVTGQSFCEMVADLSAIATPHWPVWLPIVSDAMQDRLHATFERFRHHAGGEVIALLATDELDEAWWRLCHITDEEQRRMVGEWVLRKATFEEWLHLLESDATDSPE